MSFTRQGLNEPHKCPSPEQTSDIHKSSTKLNNKRDFKGLVFTSKGSKIAQKRDLGQKPSKIPSI